MARCRLHGVETEGGETGWVEGERERWGGGQRPRTKVWRERGESQSLGNLWTPTEMAEHDFVRHPRFLRDIGKVSFASINGRWKISLENNWKTMLTIHDKPEGSRYREFDSTNNCTMIYFDMCHFIWKFRLQFLTTMEFRCLIGNFHVEENFNLCLKLFSLVN